MDERTPTPPAAPGDAVPAAGERAEETAPAAPGTADTLGRARPARAPGVGEGVQELFGTGERQRPDRSRRTLVAGALVIAVASGMTGGLIGAYLERTGGVETVELPRPGPPPPGRPPGGGATGPATHPVIGIALDMGYPGDGARIDSEAADGGPAVAEGGPGARAGLRPGDVVTGVDGRPVHSGAELLVRTRAHRPGDRLSLTVERAGTEERLTLVLGPAEGTADGTADRPSGGASDRN